MTILGTRPEIIRLSSVIRCFDECSPEECNRRIVDVISDVNLCYSEHREENIDMQENFQSLMEAVNAIARNYDMPVLYSCHPRSRKLIEQRKFEFDPRAVSYTHLEAVALLREINVKAPVITTPIAELPAEKLIEIMEEGKSLEEELLAEMACPVCGGHHHDHEHHHDHDHDHEGHEHHHCLLYTSRCV